VKIVSETKWLRPLGIPLKHKMNPFDIIKELNAIEQAALTLHAQLSDRNRTTPVGRVRESTTTHISNNVESIDRKIQFLYASNKIH